MCGEAQKGTQNMNKGKKNGPLFKTFAPLGVFAPHGKLALSKYWPLLCIDHSFRFHSCFSYLAVFRIHSCCLAFSRKASSTLHRRRNMLPRFRRCATKFSHATKVPPANPVFRGDFSARLIVDLKSWRRTLRGAQFEPAKSRKRNSGKYANRADTHISGETEVRGIFRFVSQERKKARRLVGPDLAPARPSVDRLRWQSAR